MPTSIIGYGGVPRHDGFGFFDIRFGLPNREYWLSIEGPAMATLAVGQQLSRGAW